MCLAAELIGAVMLACLPLIKRRLPLLYSCSTAAASATGAGGALDGTSAQISAATFNCSTRDVAVANCSASTTSSNASDTKRRADETFGGTFKKTRQAAVDGAASWAHDRALYTGTNTAVVNSTAEVVGGFKEGVGISYC